MREWNQVFRKVSVACPHMWHRSQFSHTNWKPVACHILLTNTSTHVTQRYQICAKVCMTVVEFPKISVKNILDSIILKPELIIWTESLQTSNKSDHTVSTAKQRHHMHGIWWCFRPLLCTLLRLNWAKQTPGIMRRNEWRNLPLSGFELATQWSEAQHATAGLRRPPAWDTGTFILKCVSLPLSYCSRYCINSWLLHVI